jgi:nucleoid-associated protein YgaU
MSTAALAASTPAARRSADDAPQGGPFPATARSATPVATPVAPPTTRRRPRIQGASTDPMPVRGCSGEVLGRSNVVPLRQAEPSTLRLTRRGLMLLTAISVIVFGSAIVVLGLRVGGVLQPGPDFTHTVPVQVAPGQTLWSIAEQTNPGQDPGTVVEKIADVNKLSSPADITPGQTLQIPIAR